MQAINAIPIKTSRFCFKILLLEMFSRRNKKIYRESYMSAHVLLNFSYIPLSSCMEGETCVESGPLLSESGLCLGGVTSVFFSTLGGLTLGFLIWGFTEVFCGSCSISFCSSTLSWEIWLSYAYNAIIRSVHDSGQINEKIQHKIVNIFLYISFNICFGSSKESSH